MIGANETGCWNCSAIYAIGNANCPQCSATNANHDYEQADREMAGAPLAAVPLAPQVPPPCWDTRPINATDAMAAVRSMSRGAA